MVELVALEIDLGAHALAGLRAQVLCDALGEVERARAADVMLVKAFKLGVKGGIGLGLAIGALKVENQRHQRLGDETSTENAEAAVFIRTIAEGIGRLAVQLSILEGGRFSGLLNL